MRRLALALSMLCVVPMSALVVFYSRTGTTRTAARAIARGLDAHVEQLVEPRDRSGFRGYLRSGFDASLERWVPIGPLQHDPATYDLVVVGTPVWASSLSAPVRTFLGNHAGRLRRVAFFVTEGGRGDQRVFRQMADVLGVTPPATLALTQHDVEGDRVSAPIAQFVSSLRRDGAPLTPPAWAAHTAHA